MLLLYKIELSFPIEYPSKLDRFPRFANTESLPFCNIWMMRFMDCVITSFVDLPESLHKSLKLFVETHPGTDSNAVIQAAIAQFLGAGNGSK